jgi:hypothetical protein
MGGEIMTPFENAIKEYLDARAKEDVKFAEKYSNEKKSIEECCRFILGEMRKKAKSGMYGATDEEVFGLAVHYYDEEDIKVEKNVSAEVVINREMTEEEKQLDRRKEAEKKTAAMIEEDKRRKEELRKRTAEDKKHKEQERKKKKEQEEEGLLFLFDEEDL